MDSKPMGRNAAGVGKEASKTILNWNGGGQAFISSGQSFFNCWCQLSWKGEAILGGDCPTWLQQRYQQHSQKLHHEFLLTKKDLLHEPRHRVHHRLLPWTHTHVYTRVLPNTRTKSLWHCLRTYYRAFIVLVPEDGRPKIQGLVFLFPSRSIYKREPSALGEAEAGGGIGWCWILVFLKSSSLPTVTGSFQCFPSLPLANSSRIRRLGMQGALTNSDDDQRLNEARSQWVLCLSG